ncbi:DUF1493 family protein [Erwinia tasmaniensis]|uniref:DUF1493 family protein n=1 Tax=Erwinia tasmaniensis TaxID=338565 RepID=UPI003A4E0CC2
MSDITVTADAVREFIRRELPLVTTFLLKKIVINDDDILQELYEADDIAEMSEKFFREFNVKTAGFSLVSYFPWKSPSLFSPHPVNQGKKPLTICMYIESAKAGYWLFG